MIPTTLTANPAAALAHLCQRWASQDTANAADVAAMRLAVAREFAAFRTQTPALRGWLFGSLVWGGFDKHSDIDIAVAGLSPADEVRLWTRLEIATGRAVDLLSLSTMPAPFAGRVTGSGIAL